MRRGAPLVLLCGGLLSACNAIFGITEANPTSSATGTGDSMSSASGTSGTGGSGGLATTSTTGPTTSTTTSTSTSSTGGAAPVCDGSGPTGPVGNTPIFAKQSSGQYSNEEATAVAIGPDGSVYAIGLYSSGDVFFNGTSLPYDTGDGSNVFVVKRHPDGLSDWAVGFKGPLEQEPLGLALDDSGHLYVAGRMEGSMKLGAMTTLTATGLDGFVAQLDAATGAVGWAKRFGGPGDDMIQQVAYDGKKHIVLAGMTNGVIDFGCAAPIDTVPVGVFLVELDAAGNCVWQHEYNANTRFTDKDNIGLPVALAVDRSTPGAIYLAGGADSPNFGQGQITGLGQKDVFVFKATSNGDYVNAKIFGALFPSDGLQYATSVAVDPCGDVLLTGAFNHDLTFGLLPTLHTVNQNKDAGFMDVDDEDMFLAKLDSSLKPIWAKSFGDSGLQRGASVAVDAFSNVTVGGALIQRPYSVGIDFGGGVLKGVGPDSYGDYLADVVVARYDASGKYQWAQRYGTVGGQGLGGVAVDDKGHTAFAGWFVSDNIGPLMIGPNVDTLLASGQDAFFIRLGP